MDENINLEISEEDFRPNSGNKSLVSNLKAYLRPGSSGVGESNYSAYIDIVNDTIYSSTNTNHDPELLLQIFDEEDNLVELNNFGELKTIKGLTGYDITGYNGRIIILSNQTITASNNETELQEWRLVISLINLDVLQNDNTGKRVKVKSFISSKLSDYCVNNPDFFACMIDQSYNPERTTTIKLSDGYIYHHIHTLGNGAGDESLRYAGPNPNNYVCFGSDDEICPAANIYRIIGLIPVDVVVDETNPNNIITERQMLYKIIKNDYMTSYQLGISSNNNSVSKISSYNGPLGNQPSYNIVGFHWNGTASNIWSTSTLSTALNSMASGYYLENLGRYSNLISKVKFKIGGGSNTYIYYETPMSTVYTNEITESGQHVLYTTSDNKNEITNKVGLMYVSDYGYAAVQTDWNVSPSAYSRVVADNWLYRGVGEWTITRNGNYNNNSYNISNNGNVSFSNVNGTAHGIRPAFYLTQDTIIDMNNYEGTITNPYRIS